MRILAVFAALVGGAAGVGWLAAGAGGAVIAGALVLLASVSLYAYASECVLHLAGVYPVSGDVTPDLYRLVERLAAQADTLGAAPRLYWLPGDAPNALTTGRDPAHAAIAMTPALLTLLERDELAGILTRELARIARRDTLVGDMVAAVAGGLMLIARWPNQFQRVTESGEQDSNDWAHWSADWVGTALRMVLAPIAAGLVRAASSAAQVYAADAAGAQILGDPLPLARALAKLATGNSTRPSCDVNRGLTHQFTVAPFSEESLRRLLCAHPPVAARVGRLAELALKPTAHLDPKAVSSQAHPKVRAAEQAG